MKKEQRLLAALTITTMMGMSGAAYAAPDNRDVVRSESGHVVVNSFGECVRTKWTAASDPCAPEKKAIPVPRAERKVIGQEERTVYFGFNQTVLTADSRQKLNSLADVLKADKEVKGARIIGYADRLGATSYNERLSQKRAERVKTYIVSRGFVNAQVAETRWLGENAPVTNCPDTLTRPQLIDCLAKDRRVEVEIDYQQ